MNILSGNGYTRNEKIRFVIADVLDWLLPGTCYYDWIGWSYGWFPLWRIPLKADCPIKDNCCQCGKRRLEDDRVVIFHD